MTNETGRRASLNNIHEPLSAATEALGQHSAELYEFGPFRLEPAERKLLRNNEPVVLTPKAFDTLVILVRNSGHLLEKEELIRALWPDSFVEEGNLTNNISLLRKALGEDSQYIETVPKRGYRFVGALRQLLSPPSRVSHVTTKPTKMVPFAVALVIALALGLVIYRQGLLRPHSRPVIQSVAVLPLMNLSSDADQDYFADGMTDALITDLGKISALRVISRTSVMQYQGTKKPLPEIARDLNVDAIIEGTVSRSGNHVRITANLVQAFPEKHLWAQSYDSEVGDALAVQGQIAQSVAREIHVTLTQKERNLLAAPRPANPVAQDLYFRGMHVFGEGTEETQETAIRYFQQAIEKDPGYAEPYSALALVHAVWVPGANRPRDRMPKAREFALKALSLDNGVTNAHNALGRVALFYDWDWATAEKEFQTELALNPNHVHAHEWLARALVTRGKTEEAVAEAKRALGLTHNPLYWDYPTWVFILARRYDLAREHAQEMVDLEPNYPWGHFSLAQVYEHEGRMEDGAREFLRADELLGTDPKELEKLKRAMAKDGAQGYWRQKVENYKKSAKSGYVSSGLAAIACVRIGDKQCAFEWLDKGFEERDDLMINIKVEPVFDGLHEDQRFQDLVHRVGIP
jgi:TolB-like protein/DNA-binding winged helix-turn-helix (wHTH) protein